MSGGTEGGPVYLGLESKGESGRRRGQASRLGQAA